MRTRRGQNDAPQGMGLVEPDIAPLPGPGLHFIGQGRRTREEGQAARRQGQASRARSQQGVGRHGQARPRPGADPWRKRPNLPRRVLQIVGGLDRRGLRGAFGPIDHQQTRLHGGPVFGEGMGWKGDPPHDTSRLTEASKQACVRQGGQRDDRGQPTMVGQGLEGR